MGGPCSIVGDVDPGSVGVGCVSDNGDGGVWLLVSVNNFLRVVLDICGGSGCFFSCGSLVWGGGVIFV